jgi:hypothetical protein
LFLPEQHVDLAATIEGLRGRVQGPHHGCRSR